MSIWDGTKGRENYKIMDSQGSIDRYFRGGNDQNSVNGECNYNSIDMEANQMSISDGTKGREGYKIMDLQGSIYRYFRGGNDQNSANGQCNYNSANVMKLYNFTTFEVI